MPEQDRLIDFPSGDQSTIIVAMAVLLALLLIAILWEVVRRHMDRTRRKRVEWQMVKEIADEKDLDASEWQLLCGLIRTFHPRAPLRVVTVRQEFSDCVDAAMRALEQRPGEYDEMGMRLRSLREHLGLDYVPFGQRIDSTRELYGGQQLWAASAEGDRGEGRWLQVSSVDEARFFARPTPGQETSEAWEVGKTYRFRMWREDDARYVFSARLASIEEGPRVLGFRHGMELERLQSRADYRVRYDQETLVCVIDAPIDLEGADLKSRTPVTRHRGRFTSLSAGGCAVIIPQLVPRKAYLRVCIELPDADPIEGHVRVVATSAISGGRQLVRGAFVDLDEGQRDDIARYVLHRQQPLMAPAENAE